MSRASNIYLDVHIAYRQACLNAIEYLTKFGYTRAQAYPILGTAPCQGHISGVVPPSAMMVWRRLAAASVQVSFQTGKIPPLSEP
jgi:formamidase